MRSISGHSGRGTRGMRQSIALIGAVLLLTAACQGAGTTPSPTGAAPVATTVPITAVPATAAPQTAPPTLAPTAGVLLPGRLLFSRFSEASHTNQGSFTALPNGTQEAAVPLPFEEGLLRWSRSGKEITVATQLADGRIGTAILAPDGTVLRTLEIPDPSLNLVCGPWSVDDARLACEAWDDTDASRRGIYSVRASDGGDLKRLSSAPKGSADFPGDFSPTGQFVFLRGPENEGGGPLFIVDAGGGEPRRLGTATFEDPGRFSPDGMLVLTSWGGTIFILDLEGKEVSSFSDDGFFLFGAVWSPDGTHIAFSRTTPGVFMADIWTSLPDGTDRQQATRTSANEINVDWGVGGN